MSHYPVTKNGKPDERYRISLVYCGYDKPHHTLYFCDEYVANSASLASMIIRAHGHNVVRMGATIIEEKE
jgi:hypothetical protein